MSALTYSWHVSNVQGVGSTTRPLPSHSAQVKETRRSVYDSESGVKKMAVGHHLSERSHTIERSHNLLSGKRAERKDFVNLEEGGSEWVWGQCGVEIGCGTGDGSGSRIRGSGVSVCVRRQCPFALVQCSGAVRLGVGRCAVFERRGTRAGPTAGQPSGTIRSSLSLGQHR